METIRQWQEWYKADKPIETQQSKPEIPGVTVSTSIYYQKAIEGFYETIAEFDYELNPKEFLECFLRAAENILKNKQEDLERSQSLVDLIKQTQTCQNKNACANNQTGSATPAD